jgi:hypothetical protein
LENSDRYAAQRERDIHRRATRQPLEYKTFFMFFEAFWLKIVASATHCVSNDLVCLPLDDGLKKSYGKQVTGLIYVTRTDGFLFGHQERCIK